jgi:hypothetical protein
MTTVEGSFQLPMSPAEAFDWFTPEGERAWVDGWHPRYPAGDHHLEPGLVFVVEAHGDTLLWVVTAVDAAEIIEYAMTVPDDRAGTVSVRLEPDDQGSVVTVRYKATALSASGQPKIEHLRRDFTATLETWRTSIINAARRADQVEAAARDGFVTYDELRGPDLDAARWSPARLPLPTGGDHVPLDPNAELAVGEGEVRVTIPRFTLSHDTFQPADSAKYLIFSTRQFELAPDRPATFAVDLAVRNIGGQPGDFRRGMAAFHAFDFDVSKRVFAVCGTSTRVLALHEQLGASGAGNPFYHVVESPYEDFDDDFTRLRACEVTLDRSTSTAAWRVDGRTVYEIHDNFIPERVRIGFGIWTMLPIRNDRSRSLDGQGMTAHWRRFRVRGVDA